MMWTTCFRDGTIVFGAIESTIATGPSNCTSASMPSSSRSSRRSASISVSPLATPPPGQQPVLLARLLLPAEQHPPLPAEDRADPDPRLHQPDDPKPSAPRSLVRQLVDLDELDRRHLQDHELRDPHARLDHERLAASWLTRLTSSSPR